jgi:hypothetical protein
LTDTGVRIINFSLCGKNKAVAIADFKDGKLTRFLCGDSVPKETADKWLYMLKRAFLMSIESFDWTVKEFKE